MRTAVIGVGHVGLVTAACLARWGHDVVGMDDDDRKVKTLKGGGVPFHEPGLEDLIEEGREAGRLRFAGEIGEALEGTEVAFVCVGTPSLPGGAPNLSYVERVGQVVATTAREPIVLVEKSTVPANTGIRLQQVIHREQSRHGNSVPVDVASNPEFLREGSAVEDTLRPDRIVVGAESDRARSALRQVYGPVVEEFGTPYVETDLPTAELIKHASNAFLATRISFINAVARICEEVGADVEVVAEGMGHDHRIGPHFLRAGMGFGGSCLVADETVLAQRDGVVEQFTMAEFYERVAATGVDGWEVLAWQPQGRNAEFLPVAAVTARPYVGDLIEVRTKMGRRVRCTADHPFVVTDGEGVSTSVRLAEDLTTDDWLPMACGRKASGTYEAVSSPLVAIGAGVVASPDVIQRLDPEQFAAVREHAGSIPRPRRYDVLRSGTMRLEEFAALGLGAEGGHFGTAKNGTYIPGEITLDEDFWRMIGLFLADGFVTSDKRRMRVHWTFHLTDEEELVDFVTSYWERLGVKVSVYRRPTATAVSVSSRLLASWFADVLRLGCDCYEKRIPDLIWDAPPEHKRALLRGLWDGDGSWSLVNGGPSVVLEYGTASRRLADGMLRLLGDLGVVASVHIGRTSKSTVDTYWLRISGADQVEDALWLFPSQEAEKIRATIAGQAKRIAPTGYRRRGSTAWVRVTSTRREPFDGWVYSLEVPGAHTVVTTGGLVTHNCFPKDVNAFIHLARSVGYDFRLLEEVRRINEEMREHVLEKLRAELWHLEGKTVTLLGAAFKPGTDDLREAPAIWLARRLLEEGAHVRVYDPVALPNVKEMLEDVECVDEPLAACEGAHAAVVCTEWDEITALTGDQLAAALGYPIVIDGRNCLDRDSLEQAGITYHGIGRPPVEPRRS